MLRLKDESVFEDAEAFKPERWLRNKDTALIEAVEALKLRFSSIWFNITYVPRSTNCRVRASPVNGQNRAAV